MYYRTYKTTMGRKYRMRITEDEKAERELYWLAVTVLPFITAAGMMLLWVKGV